MVAIEIAIEIEIGTIRDKFDSDPDFDFEGTQKCCTAKI
jgi:hypothetical protein